MDYHKAEQKRINDEIERLEFEIAEADINRRRTINLNQRRIAELRQEQDMLHRSRKSRFEEQKHKDKQQYIKDLYSERDHLNENNMKPERVAEIEKELEDMMHGKGKYRHSAPSSMASN